MDIRQLRYFIAIVEGRSFTRAAAELRVAQPALSQHVLAMEDELGVDLLRRGPRGVFPTEAGLRLLDRARIIDAQFSELRGQVRNQANHPSGDVKFGMPAPISDRLSIPLIETARRQYPEVRVCIAEAMSGFQLRWLREQVVDIALAYGPMDENDLIMQHVLTQEIVLYGNPGMDGAPRGESVTLAAALKLPLILPSPMQGMRRFIDSAAHSIEMPVNPVLEVDSHHPEKYLVSRGIGYSMLPMAAIDDEVRKGALRIWHIKKPKLEAKIFFAYRESRPLSDAAIAIGNLSLAIMRDLVKSGAWKAKWNENADAIALDPRSPVNIRIAKMRPSVQA